MREIKLSIAADRTVVRPGLLRHIATHPSLRFSLGMIGSVWLFLFMLEFPIAQNVTSRGEIAQHPRLNQLIIETRIRPGDIDRVRRDQTATVQFITPDGVKSLNATVTWLARDLVGDSVAPDAQPYYPSELTFNTSELRRLQDLKLPLGTQADIRILGSPTNLFRLYGPSMRPLLPIRVGD